MVRYISRTVKMFPLTHTFLRTSRVWFDPRPHGPSSPRMPTDLRFAFVLRRPRSRQCALAPLAPEALAIRGEAGNHPRHDSSGVCHYRFPPDQVRRNTIKKTNEALVSLITWGRSVGRVSCECDSPPVGRWRSRSPTPSFSVECWVDLSPDVVTRNTVIRKEGNYGYDNN